MSAGAASMWPIVIRRGRGGGIARGSSRAEDTPPPERDGGTIATAITAAATRKMPDQDPRRLVGGPALERLDDEAVLAAAGRGAPRG